MNYEGYQDHQKKAGGCCPCSKCSRYRCAFQEELRELEDAIEAQQQAEECSDMNVFHRY